MTNIEQIKTYFDSLAPSRDWYRLRNKYYHKELAKFLNFIVPRESSVLEVGSSTGTLLHDINPLRGIGIDISSKSVEIAQNKYPRYNFFVMDVEKLDLGEKFDFIIVADVVGLLGDIQKVFENLKKVSHPRTRLVISYYNHLWAPIIKIAEKIGMKMPEPTQNWLSSTDIENLLNLAGFEVIKKGKRFLIPKYIPILSYISNTYLNKLPFLRKLSLINYFVARPRPQYKKEHTVSIVVPAKNEKGNIENVIMRIPRLGRHTEIIFVEGHSRDGTFEEMKRIREKYPEKDVKVTVQNGKGKGDAVRKGFDMAEGEVLMILDADLTVRPEDLPKFYDAIASGKGEYINGSRLVYPMQNEAMRFLNLLGNKFFSMVFTWLLDQRLKDTLCGTKVLFKNDYEKIKEGRSYFGDFDPFGDFDLLFGAAKQNLKFAEIPIRYQNRTYGETQIHRWKHGWLLLKMSAFALRKIKFI